MSNNSIDRKIEELETRVTRLEQIIRQPVSMDKQKVKQISAKEFLLQLSKLSGVQKTLALAYYLEIVLGQTPFTAAELERAFRDAREKAPSNINDMINKNISKGHLMEAKEGKSKVKAWLLTATGENLILSLLERKDEKNEK